MAIKVTDAATAARKFAQRGAAAAQDYAAGVQDAITRGAFSRGVTAAGANKYEQRATTIGARRFPEGVREGAPAWEAGTAPFLQTIASLTLPPRRPKGDPANFQRVQAVGEALRRRKVGG